ncbi:MAG: S46 family peptidase, partial [Chlorobiota bacterium]
MLTYFKKHKLKVILFSLLFVLAGSRIPDEGMFPLSEIPGLNLKEAGLKIDVKDIYNPDGVSLIDALVKLNGCTGSFVSDDGLILTNHHCAFDFVAEASTVENNYLENGFIANDRGMEIPAK